ncbi:MAG: hypothetical protein Kow0037_05130 [Calditrichia bacterium]
MANINNQGPRNMPQGNAGAQGFRLVGFPKEFEKSFWDVFDKRYYTILLITWIVVYLFTYFMTTREWKLSEQEQQRLKQSFMSQLYATIEVPETTGMEAEEAGGGMEVGTEVTAEEKELQEKAEQRTSESKAEQVQRVKAGKGQRQAKRRKMEQEAAGYGIVGAITAAGGAGSGPGQVDILGEAGGVSSGLADAGALVQGTAGLEAGTRVGQRSRLAKGGGFGEEVGETTIDDLVSGTGVSGGASVTRRGGIKLAEDTRVSGAGASATQRDPEVIDAVINENKASVEYCYQKQLKVDPNLRGEILISFDILPNGRVGAVKIVNSTLNNRKAEQCIIRAVRRWSNFPKIQNSKAIVTIRTKFVFG